MEGSGSQTATIPHEGELALIRFSHTGDGPLSITVGDPDGQEVLTSETEVELGSRARGLAAGDYEVQITSEGDWILGWEQPRYTAAPELPQLIEGRGHTATNPFSTAGGEVRFEWTQEGEEDLTIVVLTADGEPAGEIEGPGGETTVDLSAGIYLLDVVGEGVWRVTVS